MNIQVIDQIIRAIREQTERQIASGKRDQILNERIFHHSFSSKIAKWYERQGKELWDELLLIPECRTCEKFRLASITLEGVAHTRENAIGIGQCGNLDFALTTNPEIVVEWKGPVLFSQMDAVEVFLKLLTQPVESIKVFAAIITSSKTGRRDHVEKLGQYFRQSLDDHNLYAFVTTLPDAGAIDVHWGPVVS
jgi:hypothetical protein